MGFVNTIDIEPAKMCFHSEIALVHVLYRTIVGVYHAFGALTDLPSHIL